MHATNSVLSYRCLTGLHTYSCISHNFLCINWEKGLTYFKVMAHDVLNISLTTYFVEDYMYMLYHSRSMISLLLHESEAEPRMSVNNKDIILLL